MNMSKEHLSHCNYGMLTLLLGICTLVLLHIGRRPIICDIEFQNCSFIVIGILCCFFAFFVCIGFCTIHLFHVGVWTVNVCEYQLYNFVVTHDVRIAERVYVSSFCVSFWCMWILDLGHFFLCKKLGALWYFIDLTPVVTFGSLGLTEIRYPFHCSTCQKHVCWL